MTTRSVLPAPAGFGGNGETRYPRTRPATASAPEGDGRRPAASAGRVRPVEPVELTDVIEAAISRVRIRAPGLTFTSDLTPVTVPGRPGELERMV